MKKIVHTNMNDIGIIAVQFFLIFCQVRIVYLETITILLSSY